jgi:hypothetical protein
MRPTTNSKGETYAGEDIPSAAKRRRLERTQGDLIDSPATWNPSNGPTSQPAVESVWANDLDGGVVSQFNLNPSTALRQPETSSLSGTNLPGQWNKCVDARWQSMNQQSWTSSSSMAPNYGSFTVMVGENLDGLSAAHDYTTSTSTDWKVGGQLGHSELDPNTFWNNQWQPDHRSLVVSFPVEQEPKYSAQIHSFYGTNSLQPPEPIQSNALNAEASLQAQMGVASQENTATGLGSNLPCANNESNGSAQAPSGAGGNEIICFGMVRTSKPP